jgi:hypothetical protein
VEGAGDLVVEVDGAGQRVGTRVALKHGDRDAVVGQQQRGGAADRAGADDDHVRWMHDCSFPVSLVTGRW